MTDEWTNYMIDIQARLIAHTTHSSDRLETVTQVNDPGEW